MKTRFLCLWAIVTFLSILSCSKDDDPQEILTEPSLSNIEVGSGNNGQGTIGRDFHLNADIDAGEKIDMVTVDIIPREGEEYTQDWSFTIEWDEFKGLRNTTVHKHFDIPEDASEGIFDFVITVTDENGTSLEEVYDLELIDAANLPIDPKLYLWSIENSNGDSFFVNETLENPEGIVFTKNDTLTSSIQIQNVKDDGMMYLLLIKKDLDHFPETVENIDFSKAIVFDVYEHTNEEEVYTFWNTPYNSEINDYERWPELIVGANNDNHTPDTNSITGDKTWENGEYYFGVVYTNSTHEINIHHYIPFTIEGF